MKVEEINKTKIGDLVDVHYTSSDTNSIVKIKHVLVDNIEYYPSGGVRIIKRGYESFKWWEIQDVFTREQNPELFI